MSSTEAEIQCPACGEANRPGRRFCAQCGVRFEPRCPSCGEQNEAGERFCGECGTPLEAGAAPAQPAATPDPQIGSEVGAPSPPRSPDPSSVSAGRYLIERFLGEGARKRVFLARDQRLDREVALAIVKTDGLDDTGLTRVRREAEAMGRLGDHPNVVTVFDVDEDQGQVVIVSRYVSGGDLESRLSDTENRRLSAAEALRIAGDVAGALAHAHERGVIHRDVKPGNIWLDAATGAALLGDFGLAAQNEGPRITQEGTMLGTVAYMPPEQALGRTADARSDLYALGATLYEMLTGVPPFPGEDTVAVIAQHINAQPVNPSWHEKTVPRALDALVLRLLAKDPADRPPGASEVVDALAEIARTEADRSTSVGTSRSEDTLPPTDFGLFVGRERELGQLQEIYGRVLAGEGSVAMLVGEPGIGKTRLSKEFTVHARLRGAQVVMGPCYEGEGSIGYQPFIGALRAYLTQSEDDAQLREELGAGAPELASLVPEIRERFPDLPEAPPLEGEAERQRLFESMAGFVSRASAATPLVIILDDLHWADKPTLLLLLHLARRIRSDRLLLIGTYRDVELDRTHPLADTVATLRGDGLYERVLLRGLDEAGVGALLSARAGGQQVPETFITRIRQETEGNPFFVEEVVKHLAEINAIRRENGEWVGDLSVVERSIPEGIREVIGHRLTRLTGPCNAMLTVGSAMTGGFSFKVMSTVCDESEDALMDHLDEALRAQVIRERDGAGGGSYEFGHALIRQTLYQELSTPRRVRLHRQIGEALEKLYGLDAPAHLAALAHHYFQGAPGGDVEKAITTSMRAAEHALGQMAWEEAVTHTGHALEALDMLPAASSEQRYDLLFALGDAQRLAGERTGSRKNLGEAAELARGLGDEERLARAALAYSAEDVTVQFDGPDVTELLKEGLAAVGPEDSALRVRLLSRLSIALIFTGTHEERESLALEAIEISRRLGDDAALCRSLFVRDLASPSRFDPSRKDESAETWELAKRSGNPDLILGASLTQLWEAAHTGEAATLDAMIEDYRQRVAEVRQPAFLWYSTVHQALLHLLRGPLDEAERQVELARAEGLRCEHPLAEFFHICHRGVLHGARGGDLAASERMIEFWETPFGKTIDIGATRATSLISVGRINEAREQFLQTARKDFADIPRDVNWFSRIYLTAQVCVTLGETAHASTLLQLIEPYADRIAIAGPFALCWGPLAQALGRLTNLLGRHDETVAHYEAGLSLMEGLEFRVLLAPMRLELAHVLLERGEPGDRARALELTGSALSGAEEVGMPPTIEAALALKLEIQGVEPSGNLKESVYVVAEAVEQRRPDLGSHAAPDGTVTLLFSDMEGFASMTDRLGDLKAREVIRQHNGVVREQLAAHGGYEVELQGDGFLLAFGSARQGLLCAIAIQEAFATRGARGGEPIRVRIGVHTGEALRDADKFFGKTVILAARIAAEAAGGEILVSTLVRDLTQSTGDLRFGREREVALKGISGSQRLVPIEWR